ncbi:hypothetical protein HAX54_019186, partial [Datura stramonium]|nr:hypothetical protein [Datura stramonium]
MLESEDFKEYVINDTREVDKDKGKQRGEEGSNTLSTEITTDKELEEKKDEDKETSNNIRTREEEKHYMSTTEWIGQAFSNSKETIDGRPIFGIGNLLDASPQEAVASSATAHLPTRWRRAAANAPSRSSMPRRALNRAGRPVPHTWNRAAQGLHRASGRTAVA